MRKGYFGVLAAVAVLCLAATAAEARPRITLYEHVGYGGASRSFSGDEPNLAGLGFNDIASSARVSDGVWEICEHVNYRGRCIRVGRDNPNLVDDGFNDVASSVRLVRGRDDDDEDDDRGDHGGRGDWGGGRGDWGGGRGDHGGWGGGRGSDITLFEHVGYGGDQRRLDGDTANLDRVGFNDTVSSLRIRRGVWQVCEHAFFRGRCMTFDHDVPDLVRFGFNDVISSVRRVR